MGKGGGEALLEVLLDLERRRADEDLQAEESTLSLRSTCAPSHSRHWETYVDVLVL